MKWLLKVDTDIILVKSFVISIIICVIYGQYKIESSWYDLLLVVSVIPISIIFYYLTKPFAKIFPRNIRTVGDLVKMVLAYNFNKIKNELNIVNEDEIWTCLMIIVSEECGLEIKEISKRTKLADLE